MSKTNEYLAWLNQPADASGECDRCHADDVALWRLPLAIDNDTESNWMYCRECFARNVVRAKANAT